MREEIQLNDSFKVIFIIWAAAVMASTLIFVMGTPGKNLVKYLAWFFLLLSESAAAALLAFTSLSPGKRGLSVLSVGVSSTAGLYLLLSLGVAALTLAGAIKSVAILVTFEFIFLFLLVAIALIFFTFNRRALAEDDSISQRAMRTENWERRLNLLLSKSGAFPELKSGLAKVLDEVRYFSRTVEAPVDQDFARKLLELEGLFGALAASPNASGEPSGDAGEASAVKSPEAGPLIEAPKLLTELLELARLRREQSVLAGRGAF
jgi:hypothetical protein